MRRNRRTAAVLALVAVALALWWMVPGAISSPAPNAEQADESSAAPGRPAQQQASAANAAGAPPAVVPGSIPPTTEPSAPPATVSPAPTGGADQAVGEAQVVALAGQAAREYRALAQYPPWSRPFNEEGEDPILRDRLVSPVIAAGPDGADPTLVVFPDQVSFEAPDAVLLYAYLSVNDTRVPAAAISGTIMTESLQPLLTLTYGDDGDDGDRVAADNLYTARFAPGPDFAPELSESFLVRVVADTIDGEQRIAASGFQYSNPHAQLTGAYRDAIVDGSLAIDAQVEVVRGGRFHLEGTLYSQDGQEPIGEAHTAGELAPGRHWMRLTFFGRIVNQSAVDGPYLLRFLALSTTTAMPNAKNRLVVNAHLTAAYRFAQFDPAPFDDPDLLDAAERLEADLRGPEP